MIKKYSAITGSPILHFDDGSLLGMIKDPIIDPATGKIEAFWVKALTLPNPDAVLQVQNIVEWKKNVYVKDDGAFADPADIIKISEILARNIYFLGNTVWGQSGKTYGRVYDIDFDTAQFYLNNLYVQKSVLWFIKLDHRVFNYDQIIDVQTDHILITDDSSKKEPMLNKEEQPA